MIEILIPDTPFQHWLADLNACRDARVWVGTKTVVEAWAEIDKKDWMEWFLERAGIMTCICPSDSCPFLKVARLDPAEIRTEFSYESWKDRLPSGVE